VVVRSPLCCCRRARERGAHLSVLVDKVDLYIVSVDAFARDVPCLPTLVLVGEPDARIGRERVDELAALGHSRGGVVGRAGRVCSLYSESVKVCPSNKCERSSRRVEVQEPTNARDATLSRVYSRLFREPVDHTVRKVESLSSRPCSSPACYSSSRSGLSFSPLAPTFSNGSTAFRRWLPPWTYRSEIDARRVLIASRPSVGASAASSFHARQRSCSPLCRGVTVRSAGGMGSLPGRTAAPRYCIRKTMSTANSALTTGVGSSRRALAESPFLRVAFCYEMPSPVLNTCATVASAELPIFDLPVWPP
jgi:hypothetical protein